MFNTYYETYGRKVELVRYDATGTISDAVAATADAETIADDIQPFAVIGGPLLTNAFADTLAGNKVHVHRVHARPADRLVRGAVALRVGRPARTPMQSQMHVAEYIGKRLWPANGRVRR